MREAVKKKIEDLKKLQAQTHPAFLIGMSNDFYQMIHGLDNEGLKQEYYADWTIDELKAVCDAMGWKY